MRCTFPSLVWSYARAVHASLPIPPSPSIPVEGPGVRKALACKDRAKSGDWDHKASCGAATSPRHISTRAWGCSEMPLGQSPGEHGRTELADLCATLAAERGDEVTEEVTACTRCRVCAGQAAYPTSCQGGRVVSRPLCKTRL